MSLINNDMLLGNDIADIQDNLLLKKDGSVFALYEIKPFVINKVDRKKQETAKEAVAAMLENIKPYVDFDIVMLPFSKELESRYIRLAKDFAHDETEDLAYTILDKSFEKLMYQQELCDYHYFMSVPLKSLNVSVDLKTVLKDSVTTSAARMVEYLGFQSTVFEGWQKDYDLAKAELEKQLDILDIQALSTMETIFVNRYLYLRTLVFDKEHELNLVDSYIDNLGDTSICFDELSVLEFHNDSGKNYVAFIPLARSPENMSYIHTFDEILTLGFPVEVFTKARFSKTKGLPNHNIRYKGRVSRARLKNAQGEAAQAGSVGKKSIARSKFLVENMEQKIDDAVPMISYLQTFVVFDSDYQFLLKKIDNLIKNLKNAHLALSRANADQLYLFGKNKFGTLLSASDKNFVQHVELSAFAENLFFVNQEVGQRTGFYLGKIDSRIKSWHSNYEEALEASDKPVFFNLFEANKEGVDGKETSNPHIQVSGDSGVGKTFLVSLIHLYSSLLKSQTLYIDPKAEKRKRYKEVLEELEDEERFPELQRYIRSLNFVTLDSDDPKNIGVLDPLVFLKETEAKDLIVSMLGELLNMDNEKAFKIALLPLIDKYSRKRWAGEQVGTLSIFKELQQSENIAVKETADLLIEEIKNSVLGLVFGEGQNPAVDLTARNTILEVAGLELPANEHVRLTDQNKKALVIMYALGRFCEEFGKRDYRKETAIYIDEAWFMQVTSYGRAIVDKIKRVGRSQNNFLIFVSQEPDDSNRANGEANAFGTYFCFYNDADKADEKVLRRLKVDVTAESKRWFNQMTKAQCLYKDTYGRVERITVDGLLPEFGELFKTVESEMEAIG
ncbi:ATP-binding protein [Streptococcus chenjunshii]|nr:ATP-binding protein [Streptococcus chenjunshii]